jgi:hypothetical protein
LSCTSWFKTAFITTDPKGVRSGCHLMCRTDTRLQGRPSCEVLIVLATILTETPVTYSTAIVSCAQCGVYISFELQLSEEGGKQAGELPVARA